MNRYRVEVAFEKYEFDRGEAALSFAEVARKHINDKKAAITIVIEEEEAEDGR